MQIRKGKVDVPLPLIDENSKKFESDFLKLSIADKVVDNYYLLLHRRKIKTTFYLFIVGYVFYKSVSLKLNSECLVEMPFESSKVFREPENCNFCKDLTEIRKVTSIHPNDFLKQYAKHGVPVIVSDGALNWPASKVFSFEFFKKLHQQVEVNRSERKNCQFFPYRTEFKELSEVFNMSEKRANLDPNEKPWYVGWSNCNDAAGKILSQYYSKPYFLGNNSENIALSWIFMGGPGYGAQMHVDNVHYPSWQAQLSGRKMWKLMPPPECYYTCQGQEVIVEPGEIKRKNRFHL